MEIQFLPPTGKRVQVTDELVTFTVKNGKVTWIEAVRVEGGLLAQLDITLAAHP
ncbi:MAG TPA: hypothetical protein VFF59_01440 [Anaerolineae bacterium]|nr:hypothetical protein [Anaerolineae bacterium]